MEFKNVLYSQTHDSALYSPFLKTQNCFLELFPSPKYSQSVIKLRSCFPVPETLTLF